MKKVFYAFALLAVVAAAFTGCKKDDGDNKDDKVVKRLAMCGDKWDKYYFTYNQDGTIAAVKRNPSEDGSTWERTWTFTWKDKVGTAVYVKEGTEQGNCVFTLGDNGFLASYANEYGDTWTFTYDKSNYLTEIKRFDRNTVKAHCRWENGNRTGWSRFKDDGSEQWKVQTFLNQENVGGVCPDAPDSDKCDIARWIFEVGLAGKPAKQLIDQSAWEGSETASVYTYEKDTDNFVTTVSKVYGEDTPELYYYEWEEVK